MERVKLIGHSKLRDQDGNALENRIQIEVDGGTSRVTADSPMPTKFRLPVESDSPEVAAFLLKWAADIRATARFVENRNRRPNPDPKPKDRPGARQKPPAMVALLDTYTKVQCPACNGEGWSLCELCDGEAFVTRQCSESWRTNNGKHLGNP